MELGVLRAPVAVLTALSFLASGCGLQRVAFKGPPGASVMLDGCALGAMPLETGVKPSEAHYLEVTLSPQVLDALGIKSAGPLTIKGALAIPSPGARPAAFLLDAASIRAACEPEGIARVTDGKGQHPRLFFKGSLAGVGIYDPEVDNCVPTSGLEVVGQALEIIGGAILVAALIVVLLLPQGDNQPSWTAVR